MDDFEKMVCLAIYSASNSMTRHYRPSLDEVGITYPQMLVLKSLWDFGPLPINRIALHTVLDTGALTEIIKRLESKSLVVKALSKTDGRSKIITLTKEAIALEKKVEQILTSMSCTICLSDDERTQILSICRKITAQLNAS